MQPPTATRLVTSLENAGLVAREIDRVDRRVVRVRITADGRRNLQRIRTLKNAFLTRRLAALDPAEQALAEDLTRLLEHLVADGMSPLTRAARQTFQALRVRNYRLYFFGQVISASGTWMHAVALGLLVLSDQLHGNGVNVGIVTALQFLPMLLLGSWGGLIVDRVDKRRLLYVTQSASGVLALALGLLVAVGTITMWEVYLISTLFGVVNLFDNPARQTFVSEMVGRDLMPNAISLNSVVMNSARVIGPAIGGILIFTVGLAACFLFNAASYVAVLVALFMMRPAELHQRPTVVRAKGQVREGLRYVWSTRELRDPLLAMAVVGIFAFNFTTTLPLLATRTFHGGAGTYSALISAMGAGAVVGGLMVAHRSRPSTTMLSLIGLAFGVMLLVVAAAPTEIVALVALVFMGLCSISFISTANATIQMQADPSMRGRVMALYAIAFLGSTPIGAPLVGWIADVTNPRVSIMVGGVATLAACIPLALRYRRGHMSRVDLGGHVRDPGRRAGRGGRLRSPAHHRCRIRGGSGADPSGRRHLRVGTPAQLAGRAHCCMAWEAREANRGTGRFGRPFQSAFPGTSSTLNAVSCTGPTACTAVGDYAPIVTCPPKPPCDQLYQATLIESWNGSDWSVVPSPNAPSFLADELTGVSCTDPSACTAVGYADSNGALNQTLIESWNGTVWSIVQVPILRTTSPTP